MLRAIVEDGKTTIEADAQSARVLRGGQKIGEATPASHRYLLALMEDRLMGREPRSAKAFWPGDDISEENVRTAIGRLRRWLAKLGLGRLLPLNRYALACLVEVVDSGSPPAGPFADLGAWLAPDPDRHEVWFALGTRSHLKFERGAPRYRALAVDATHVADLAAELVRRRPGLRVRSRSDIDILADLDAGTRAVTVVTLGMGNVNGVTARVVRRLGALGTLPRPSHEHSNGLLRPNGVPLGDAMQPAVGCLAALPPGLHDGFGPGQVRALLCAGVGSVGTLAASRLALALLTEDPALLRPEQLRRLKTSGSLAVLVQGVARSDAFHRRNGGQRLYRERKKSGPEVPFHVNGLVDGPDGLEPW